MNKIAVAAGLIVTAVTAAVLFAQATSPSAAPVVLAPDTQGTPDQRADQLLKQMTQQEKISLLSGAPDGFSTHAIPRLGIGSFTMSDGPVGVRNGPGGLNRGCAFPAGAAVAATWDVNLATAYGKAMGLEDRARGTHFQLGPGLNICRVPVNGRNFEYFGEDPYLASVIAANWAKACSAQGSVPTIKHFAANNQETNRNTVNAQVDERTMHEIYLPAFERAVKEGGMVAVMCSYNRLNGAYASNNDWLLNQVLKTEWGFKGLVMSDWGASHAVTDVARGLDLEMPSGQNLSQAKLSAALTDGSVKQADIDGAVRRILYTAAAQGWLNKDWQQKNASLPLDSADSAKTALDVAEASIVLLKNDQALLPLDRSKTKTIVIFGPNATAAASQVPANIGGGGSGAVTPFDARFAEADYLKGITKAAGDNAKVIYLPLPGPPADQAYAALANARTAADGEEGLTLSVEVSGDPAVTVAPTVQKAINVTWQAGQLPFGVPAGRDATFTWKGVLAPPQDADWQIHTTAGTTVTINGERIASEAILHLLKGKPADITVSLRAQANPPAGRGRGNQAPTSARVALTPPGLPDMTAAKSADAVIVCVGLNRNVESEGRDRPFDLPPIQQLLITAASTANPRTIVINNSGAAVGIQAWQPKAAAIVQAWYLGQEGGTAIGAMLFGDINPSGRLCSTFDRTFEENPAFAYYPGKVQAGANYTVEPYTEGIFYGYRGYDQAHKDPLYPFGFGLSYTTFAMSNLKVEKAGGNIKVSLDVKNTGDRAGAQVVQIYVGEKDCPLPRPLRELKGFAKLALQPGETRRAEILLPRESFAYWSPDKKAWTVDASHTFTIEAAESERDIKLQGTMVAE